VFEAVVRDEVVEFLDKHKLIRDSQHGFRKGRSCLTNILLFLDEVLRSVDEGHCVDIVFLDLAKAFDIEDNTSGTVIKFADDTQIFRDVHDNIRMRLI